MRRKVEKLEKRYKQRSSIHVFRACCVFLSYISYRISLIKMRPCLECARIRDKKNRMCP